MRNMNVMYSSYSIHIQFKTLNMLENIFIISHPSPAQSITQKIACGLLSFNLQFISSLYFNLIS